MNRKTALRKKPASTREMLRNIELYLGENLFDDWIGPYAKGSEQDALEMNEEIKRVFQAHNAIADVIDNVVNGLVAEPFVISLRAADGETVDTAEGSEGAEAHRTLTRWLNFMCEVATQKDPCTSVFQKSDCFAEFITELLVTGHSALRLFEPMRYANNADPVKRIHMHVPRPDSLSIEYDDDSGFIKKIEYAYGEGKREKHEWVDGAYVVTVNDEPVDIASDRWRIFAMNAACMIDDATRARNTAMCHDLTMLLRNQQVSGFKEKTILNAEPPKAGETVQRGPGTVSYEFGLPQGAQGEEKYTNPSIYESQPFPVENYVESISLHQRLLYLSKSQGHLLETNADVSGESRIQQRQNFHVALTGLKTPVEGAIAHVLNIVLEELGYDSYEAVVDLAITTGKMSADEKRIILEEVAAGTLSKQTAIGLLNEVSDVDAELELLTGEREEAQEMIEPEFENIRSGGDDAQGS